MTEDQIGKPTDPQGLILESWAQGMMFGSLVIMAFVTIANMRRKILLHKLILIELVFGMFQGTFIFPNPPYYGWYLSVGAIFLNTSWSMHNVIAWMKVRPFLSRRASLAYIITVALAQPYWVLEITANFLYFNNYSDLFVHTRPYEALFRDPWWLITTAVLFYNIKERYEFGLFELIRVSPRFGMLLLAMTLSIVFILLDNLAVTKAISGNGLPDGLNPFWKIAFVTKCLTDTLVLDDFKTALDRLKRYKMQQTFGDTLSPGNTNHLEAIGTREFEPSGKEGGRTVSSRHDTPNEDDLLPSAATSAALAARAEASASQGRGLTFCTVPADHAYHARRESGQHVQELQRTTPAMSGRTSMRAYSLDASDKV